MMKSARLCFLSLLCGACGDKEPTDTAVVEGNFTTEAISDGGSYRLTYATDPATIPFNDYFTMTLSVYDGTDTTTALTDVESVWVDITMPDHDHGMNVTPVITNNGGGTFTVDPALFHMTGRWVVDVAVTRNGAAELAQFDIDCCED